MPVGIASGTASEKFNESRESASMFVHGDVFVERVTWVFVSLQDDADLANLTIWASTQAVPLSTMIKGPE